VHESWSSTGFAWEQYSPETSVGQRTQHFTGWTALVVKILALPHLEVEAVESRPYSARWGDHKEGWDRSDFLMGLGLLMLVLVFRRKLMRIWRLMVG
jgi:mannosyl-oligosaccharide glucosidase